MNIKQLPAKIHIDETGGNLKQLSRGNVKLANSFFAKCDRKTVGHK